MPPAAGRRLRRKGAGEASWLAASGRSMKNRVSPLCAARLSRRSASPRAWLCQNSSAPQLPLRNTCSAAHSASALRLVRTHNSCDGLMPRAASASAWGGCGGCSSTMRRRATVCSEGRSRRSSPIPACWSNNSLSVPVGQPPPGSCADSVGCPVSTQRVLECASCEASHNEGCKASGAAIVCREVMVKPPKYCMNVQYYSKAGLARPIFLRRALDFGFRRCQPGGGGRRSRAGACWRRARALN